LKYAVVYSTIMTDLFIPELKQKIPGLSVDKKFILPLEIALKYKKFLYPVKIIDTDMVKVDYVPEKPIYPVSPFVNKTNDSPLNNFGEEVVPKKKGRPRKDNLTDEERRLQRNAKQTAYEKDKVKINKDKNSIKRTKKDRSELKEKLPNLIRFKEDITDGEDKNT
jgi:hypothetical protein